MNINKFLENAKKIRDWCKEKGKKPKAHSTDSEENKLVSSLRYIKKYIIEPYIEMNDEEKTKYKERYPEIEEIKKYIDEIEEIERDRRCKTSKKVLNMKEIKTWIEKTDSMRYPLVSSENEEERELAVRLSDINHKWLKPLYQLNTKEEKKQYIKKYPELEVVLSIMEETDLIIVRKCLEKLKSIKNEIEKKNFEGKLSGTSKDKEVKGWIEQFKEVKNIIYNMYGSWNADKKEVYKRKYPEVSELIDLIKVLNNNSNRKNFYKLRKIKKWTEEKQKIPYSRSKDEKEKRLGRSLEYIQKYIIEPYMNMSDEEKLQYKKKHPDIEEMKILQDEIIGLNKNDITTKKIENRRIKQIKEIKKWMTENNSIRYPKGSSKNSEEKELGINLYNIKKILIKPYNELETEKQKEHYRKKHPELEKIITIIEEIDIDIVKRCLEKFKEIRREIDTKKITGKLLRTSEDEEIRDLSIKFDDTKNAFDKIYITWDSKRMEEYRKKYPEIDECLKNIKQIENNKEYKYLENARKIKKWCEQKGNNKIPKSTSEDKEERGLARQLQTIREAIIKPYYALETEKEKENYRDKHPYFEKLLEILDGIDKIDVHPYVLNARNISEWSKINARIPRRNSVDEEEDRLATQLKSIRYYVVKPYIELSEKEKQNYRSENEDMCEAIEIITGLDIEYASEKKKQLAFLIKKDLEKERIIREAIVLKGKYEEELKSKEMSQNNNGR